MSAAGERARAEAKVRVEELRNGINHHAYRYHVLDDPEVSDAGINYRHVKLSFGPTPRTARLEVHGPEDVPTFAKEKATLGWLFLWVFE